MDEMKASDWATDKAIEAFFRCERGREDLALLYCNRPTRERRSGGWAHVQHVQETRPSRRTFVKEQGMSCSHSGGRAGGRQAVGKTKKMKGMVAERERETERRELLSSECQASELQAPSSREGRRLLVLDPRCTKLFPSEKSVHRISSWRGSQSSQS